MATYTKPASVTTIDEMLAIIARDLPGWHVSVQQCPPSCPQSATLPWLAHMALFEPLPSGVGLIELDLETGSSRRITHRQVEECGHHEATALAALIGCYSIATGAISPEAM